MFQNCSEICNLLLVLFIEGVECYGPGEPVIEKSRKISGCTVHCSPGSNKNSISLEFRRSTFEGRPRTHSNLRPQFNFLFSDIFLLLMLLCTNPVKLLGPSTLTAMTIQIKCRTKLADSTFRNIFYLLFE